MLDICSQQPGLTGNLTAKRRRTVDIKFKTKFWSPSLWRWSAFWHWWIKLNVCNYAVFNCGVITTH